MDIIHLFTRKDLAHYLSDIVSHVRIRAASRYLELLVLRSVGLSPDILRIFCAVLVVEQSNATKEFYYPRVLSAEYRGHGPSKGAGKKVFSLVSRKGLI
jgi:hypothetical protein